MRTCHGDRPSSVRVTMKKRKIPMKTRRRVGKPSFGKSTLPKTHGAHGGFHRRITPKGTCDKTKSVTVKHIADRQSQKTIVDNTSAPGRPGRRFQWKRLGRTSST